MSPILEPGANTHMIRLETPRLVLREHVPDDLLPLHAMLSDPAVTWYLPDMRRDDPGETEAYLRAVMRDDEASFRLRYNLMIVEKATGEAAGSVGLHVIDGGELGAHYGLGYFVRRDLWNRGYATEAVCAALAYCFAGDGFRVTASCLAENLGSRRVLEKCGFVQEGLLKRHTWHDGQWKDCAVYGKLRGND
jgi:ribosomal-protein-alanine N-acetyltransferase